MTYPIDVDNQQEDLQCLFEPSFDAEPWWLELDIESMAIDD